MRTGTTSTSSPACPCACSPAEHGVARYRSGPFQLQVDARRWSLLHQCGRITCSIRSTVTSTLGSVRYRCSFSDRSGDAFLRGQFGQPYIWVVKSALLRVVRGWIGAKGGSFAVLSAAASSGSSEVPLSHRLGRGQSRRCLVIGSAPASAQSGTAITESTACTVIHLPQWKHL